MATYKVMQDIEAEDKLLGPFSLKQFVFAIIVVVLGFINFRIIAATGMGPVRFIFVLMLLLPMALFGVLAAPLGGNQTTEVWLLARLRFFFKPRRRIWDQTGANQLVTITAPKKVERVLTNGLSQTEVTSRLTALANTLDSRGWAVKNVNINLYAEPDYLTESDRLVAPSSLPQNVPAADIGAADDMMDSGANPVAQTLEQMMHASDSSHRQEIINMVKQKQEKQALATDYGFIMSAGNGQAQATTGMQTFSGAVVAPGTDDSASPIVHASDPTADDKALLAKAAEADRAQSVALHGHIKTIQPAGSRAGVPSASASTTRSDPQDEQKADDGRQQPVKPAIIELANNDDLNVATIARQAKRLSGDDGEVVISLR
jgi:hypothetical protein